MKWMRFGGFGLAMVAVGCGSSESGEWQPPPNQPVQMEARLESFAQCQDLEAYIEDTAVLDMRAQLTWQKQSIDRWGRGGGGGIGIPVMDDGGAMPPEAMPGAPTAGDGTANPSAPKDHTDTNNQVEGVDEADFVKNDGTRIFVISGRKLYLHKSWPAESLQAVSNVPLEGYPREMFLTEDSRVVVFSTVMVQDENSGGGSGGGTKPGEGADIAPCSPMMGCYSGTGAVKVTVVNVANMASPEVVDQFYMPGNYTNARRVGDSVRMLLSDNFRYPDGLRWWPEYSEEHKDDKEWLKAQFDQMMEDNEKLIRARTLEQWLPSGWRWAPNGSKVSVGYDCKDFYRGNMPSKLGFVTVATLNLNPAEAESTVRRTSLLAEPGEVYASPDALYLASRHWWWWPEDGQKDYTYLHKFDTTQPGTASYVGSGAVEGYLLNQFSMDEHQGVLRVATTLSTWRRTLLNPWGTPETSNRITTFRTKDGMLKKVGESEELAKGERIFSARFMGNRGFVVTFRQVDPLFTFDLSDPAHPRKLGELKVPGFSTYIHPLGENHLLTIGTHVPEDQTNWRERALKLSLFDVSDLTNPKETFTQIVGTAYGWSEAAYEHKAFNFFPAKGLLAIPFTDYTPGSYDYWSGFRSELRVFHVDTATGFTPKGAINMSDLYQERSYQGWSWYWMPNVRRSVMADDYVYAISDAGVRVAHIQNLAAPLATAKHQPEFNFYP